MWEDSEVEKTIEINALWRKMEERKVTYYKRTKKGR